MDPSSDSSPSTTRSATWRRSTTPCAASTPSAIGKSNDAPALRTSAGARFTVMRCGGKLEPGIANGAAHPIPALAHARVRQSDHREAGQAKRDIHFHLDRAGLDSKDRRSPKAREHVKDDASCVALRRVCVFNALAMAGCSDWSSCHTRSTDRGKNVRPAGGADAPTRTSDAAA